MDAWTDVILDPDAAHRELVARRTTCSSDPSWKGTAVAGQRVVRSSTNDVWILARTRALPDDPPEAITAIQQQYSVVPLSRFGDAAYEPPRGILREPNVPTGPTPPSLVAAMPAACSSRGSPRRSGRTRRARPTGRWWSGSRGSASCRAERSTRVARAARRAPLDDGLRDARTLLDRYDAPAVPHVNGWRWTANTGRFGTDYTYRAFIAQTLLAANLPEDAVYPETSVDANGAPLTGERRYALHFDRAQLPPARAFWSLTLYSPDHYLVPNAIGRYTLRDTNLKRNADGSIDVAIQADAPSGDQTNWLPAPAGPFVVMLRMYWPLPAGLDGTYRVPAIRPR